LHAALGCHREPAHPVARIEDSGPEALSRHRLAVADVAMQSRG
jgi:hypothetical protein